MINNAYNNIIKLKIINNLEQHLPINNSIGNDLSIIGYFCLCESANKSPKYELKNKFLKQDSNLNVEIYNWVLDILDIHNYQKTKTLIENIYPTNKLIDIHKIYNSFEGVNQSGKSIRIERLLNENTSLKKVRPFLLGGFFNSLSKIIFDNTDISITPEPLSSTLILLAENYEDGIFNKNIIYDRTPISMIIHQATSISLFNNIHLEDYLNVYLKGMNLLFDFNKIVYIKTPLDICLTRILKLDRYKNMTDKHKEHFELMYHSFDKILNQYEKKVLKIDGNKNNINEDIKNIQNFFNSD